MGILTSLPTILLGDHSESEQVAPDHAKMHPPRTAGLILDSNKFISTWSLYTSINEFELLNVDYLAILTLFTSLSHGFRTVERVVFRHS